MNFCYLCEYVDFLSALDEVISRHSKSLKTIHFDTWEGFHGFSTHSRIGFFYLMVQKCPLLEDLRIPVAVNQIPYHREFAEARLSLMRHCPLISNLDMNLEENYESTKDLASLTLSHGKCELRLIFVAPI